jgi:hypothetical protein
VRTKKSAKNFKRFKRGSKNNREKSKEPQDSWRGALVANPSVSINFVVVTKMENIAPKSANVWTVKTCSNSQLED